MLLHSNAAAKIICMYIYIYIYIYFAKEVVVFTESLLSGSGASKKLPAIDLDSLRGSSVNIGTIQGRLARPLCKDDTPNKLPVIGRTKRVG